MWKDSNLIFLQDSLGCFGTTHFHEIKKEFNFIYFWLSWVFIALLRLFSSFMQILESAC